MEIKYPGVEADWSSTDKVIVNCIREHLGSGKRGTKWERIGGDLSEHPTHEDENWSKDDTLEDLLISASGNTVATFTSGYGLRSESVHEYVENELDEAVFNIIIKANSHLSEDDKDILYEDDRLFEWKWEQISDILWEHKKESLGNVLKRHEGADV